VYAQCYPRSSKSVKKSMLALDRCGIVIEEIILPKIKLMAIVFPSVSYFFSPDRID